MGQEGAVRNGFFHIWEEGFDGDLFESGKQGVPNVPEF